MAEKATLGVTDRSRNGSARGTLGLASLSIGALGVVFGDIGTSPLYAFRQCLKVDPAGSNPDAVLGILSLIFWSLTVVICIKYLTVMMRADNHGEGGILALLALIEPSPSTGPARPPARAPHRWLLLLGLFGASLLYGDGIITPAISVLSAVEGLDIATKAFRPYILPITIAVLVSLFMVQRRGTARVGAMFGPVMLLWFVTIGALGLFRILDEPRQGPTIFRALNPAYAFSYLQHGGRTGFLVLGAVVLAITGAEALYADMGHFGPRPIRVGWYALVYPSLLLNYLGQGALVLERGREANNPFFQLVPDWGLYPLVAIATAATVIASQALISGAFSLTAQAIELGFAPRMKIVHTSRGARGQIYLPQVNLALMVLCVLLVLGFRSSTALANAYGIAVTGTMTITTILFYAVARECWRWSLVSVVPLVGLFLLFDLSFLSANLVKVAEGGWVPIGLAVAIFIVMTTWRRARFELRALLAQKSVSLEGLLDEMRRRSIERIPGTAVFLTLDDSGIPPVVVRHIRKTKALAERVILLSSMPENTPRVAEADRVVVTDLGHGFNRIVTRWGFMELPNIDQVAASATAHGLTFDPSASRFFLTREGLHAAGDLPMARWRRRLFHLVSRRTTLQTSVMALGIPPERVVEVDIDDQVG